MSEALAELGAALARTAIAEMDRDAEVADLRALSDAATPGPWSPLVNLASDPAHLVPQNSIGIGAGEAVPAGVVADVTRVAAIAASANAAFIVAAVEYTRAALRASLAPETDRDAETVEAIIAQLAHESFQMNESLVLRGWVTADIPNREKVGAWIAARLAPSLEGARPVVRPFAVTDPDHDAPDGTVMTFERVAGAWEPRPSLEGARHPEETNDDH